jgi:hypothetical protein
MQHHTQFVCCIMSPQLFFFGGIGVWTQSFTLTKQVYHLSHASCPFCSGYFGDGGPANYLLELASNH